MTMLRAFILTIALVLGAAFTLLLFRVDLMAVWGHRAAAMLMIGATPVRIPGPYLRTNDTAQTFGEANLVVAWPSFKPVTPAAADNEVERIFVTLAPLSAEPIDRSMALYARFFEGDNWSNPGGLMMRRFRAGSPYQDEEFYFAPPEGEAFAARCPRQGSSLDVGQQNCIWLFRASGIDIQVRFSAALLPQWTRLNDGVRGLIGQWVEAGRAH